ncbi:adapter molecule Crk isoform X1 [Pogonomyrmex barbatus]|uniref:Adapter molecule Crk isoform X1 n=7 Tax=Myrmicinae TaxID=34695 RepID=A0A6I9W367_9HYME|nr:PREDICTED: adapter molecule Crk isoform X1 [Acromyrmex echinatior]XP_011635697.1 adapter molecule Crk isoform X1 [Pogonomyrmex barbatus]XP_018344948.1 PREDICTED: adapter molecule Crk [Trachymyrmex septentrionalis]EGI65186.1 Adapter molecule Crk [Acromyrmex echinatior]
MAATFDQYDKSSWYFGAMSRQDASDLLMGEKEGGVFLVRDSTSIHGDFVLCVREDSKVSHYIINKIQQGDQIRYRIGDQMFPDIPSLLAFYKLHYLDTTPLIRPAPKKTQRVIAKYDFEGNDSEDLPFRKGDILTVISKDEEQWWTARNSVGQTGSIPVPYVQKYDDDSHMIIENNSRPESGGSSGSNSNSGPTSQVSHTETTGQATVTRRSNIQRTLPAFAKVKQARVPNAYDKTALKLEVGDMIKVTKTNINGQWEGELHGKVGHFPFTHVEFVDNETGEDNQEI